VRRWQKWCLAVIAGSAVVHVAAVWGTPRLIMRIALNQTTKATGGVNTFLHPPRATAEARKIVRPSPDLSYSICVADVSRGPVRVTAPVTEPYTSVAVFAANSDNVFALNDRETGGRPIELTIAAPDQPVPEGTAVVRLPSERAIILVRRVIKDDAHLAAIEAIRREARCASGA
jgi:uncharacterized membrane protein